MDLGVGERGGAEAMGRGLSHNEVEWVGAEAGRSTSEDVDWKAPGQSCWGYPGGRAQMDEGVDWKAPGRPGGTVRREKAEREGWSGNRV